MLFATRRSYNASKKAFTNNLADLTRYVWVKDQLKSDGSWEGGSIKKDTWFERVQSKAGSRDVLIYIHGFNTTQITNLRRLKQLEDGLASKGYKGSVVAFEWPSNGNPAAYDPDLLDAKKSAPFLVSDLILPFLSGIWKPRVHLLAHSMGGYSVLCGFRDFGDSHGPGTAPWKVDQVAFASADVHRPSMEKGAWGSLVMKHHSKRFTNYYNAKDRVLQGSKLLNGTRKRVGSSGLLPPVFNTHLDVSCTSQYERDVSDAQDGFTYSHRWWFESEAFYKDLALTLAGKDGVAEGTRKKATNGDFVLDV